MEEARGFPTSSDPSLSSSNQLACSPQYVLEHKKRIDHWCPHILIRALVHVCLRVLSSTHRELGFLQDTKMSILEGDTVLPRGGNPPVSKSQQQS